MSSSSLSRAARSALHAWKAFPAAFLTRPLCRNSRASLASTRASRSLAAAYSSAVGLGRGFSRASTSTYVN
ncbi:MAG: hypothetical protein QXW94_04720 [Desulfurococcaceae archaeon]